MSYVQGRGRSLDMHVGRGGHGEKCPGAGEGDGASGQEDRGPPALSEACSCSTQTFVGKAPRAGMGCISSALERPRGKLFFSRLMRAFKS